jgi:hypothetical protein
MAGQQNITTRELAVRAAILNIAADDTLLIKAAGVAGRLYEQLTIGSGLAITGDPGSKVLSSNGGILSGYGSPSSSLGSNGAFYIDLLNNVLYGPRVGGYGVFDNTLDGRTVGGLAFRYTGNGNPSNFTVTFGTVSNEGEETIAWTSTGVTICVDPEVSTIADILATVGTNRETGTPWANLSQVLAGVVHGESGTWTFSQLHYFALNYWGSGIALSGGTSAIQKLATVDGVDITNSYVPYQTPLYQVPVGKNAIITQCIARATRFVGAATQLPWASIVTGYGNAIIFFSQIILTEIHSAQQNASRFVDVNIDNGVGEGCFAQAIHEDWINFSLNIPAAGDGLDLIASVDLFGYLVDAT